MSAAIFGLLGVLLGAVLSVTKDWWFQRLNRKRDVSYLAVQVVGLLDRYVFACAAVVSEVGQGQRDENGFVLPQVRLPNFDPESLRVEWRALPVDLLYAILDLPYQAEVADQSIEGVWQYSATPPDFENIFEERYKQYSKLGLDAAALAKRVRSHAGLPDRSIGSDWDPVKVLQEKWAEVNASAAECQRRWEASEEPPAVRVASDA